MKNIDMLLVYPKPGKDSPLQLTPLSILYPGALFESQGMRVAYHDDRFDTEESLIDLIKHSKEIGVSAFTGFQCGEAARILKLAKRLNPEIVTGVGGHHARILPDQVQAEPFVDKVWPLPSYGEYLFPFKPHTEIHFKRTDMQYFTSRGCPFACRFCALRSPWEPKDAGDIDRELRAIHEKAGFDYVSFADPNIAYDRYKDGGGWHTIDSVSRIRQIGKTLRDLKVFWDGNIRSPDLTPEMVESLVYANCTSIEIGCESGNEYFLRNLIKKGHGVEAIKTAAKNIRGSGISMMYSFIANMPGETPAMLRDTMELIDWIVDTDPAARVSIYNYTPYPGSPMFDDAVNGVGGYPKFTPPTTMEGWAQLRLMQTPIYWITGLNFRMDNTKKNFPGEDWKIIEPYVKMAQSKWKSRDVSEFPCEEVERLIERQFEKRRIAAEQEASKEQK
ncbi:MAG: radical SAM protein [Lentisphaerae bacterium GWF2_52_8]|nr:MAG: radical SAM protein [Lentisphaerae bacterium GWF2_52_8]